MKGKLDQQGIWLARTDGSEWKRLVQIGGGSDVAWSPDSRKVAFTDPEGMVYILTVNSDGQKERLYSATPEGAGSSSAYLAWSPDSQELLLEWTPGSGERGVFESNLALTRLSVEKARKPGFFLFPESFGITKNGREGKIDLR